MLLFMLMGISNLTGTLFRGSLQEQRDLQTAPKFKDLRHLKSYLNEFDTFYKDAFPYRELLIYANNVLLYQLFNSPGHKDVVIGKSGWLYYFPQSQGTGTIGDFTGQSTFSEKELQKISENLKIRARLLAQRGIKLYLFLHPNKQTIYPEYMPDTLAQRPGVKKLDQVFDYLTQHTDIKVMASHRELRKKKGDRLLYFRTDSHWNSLGAYYGYRKYAEAMAADFSAIRPVEMQDLNMANEERNIGGDTARLLGLEHYMKDSGILLTLKKKSRVITVAKTLEDHNTHFRQPGTNLPSAYFLCDSFIMYGTLPFFAENFSDSYFVWHGLPYDTGKIKSRKIDIMVLALTERFLSYLLSEIRENDPFRIN